MSGCLRAEMLVWRRMEMPGWSRMKEVRSGIEDRQGRVNLMIKLMPKGVLVDIVGGRKIADGGELTGSRVIVRARENFKFKIGREKVGDGRDNAGNYIGEKGDDRNNTGNYTGEKGDDRSNVEGYKVEEGNDENDVEGYEGEVGDDGNDVEGYTGKGEGDNEKEGGNEKAGDGRKNNFENMSLFPDLEDEVQGRSLMLLVWVESDGGAVREDEGLGRNHENFVDDSNGPEWIYESLGRDNECLDSYYEGSGRLIVIPGAYELDRAGFELNEDEILVRLKVSLEELNLESQDLKLIEVFAEERGAYFSVFAPCQDKIYEIYSDGACRGNPGPGGYAAILLENREVLQEISGGFQETTNNRMELMAVIRGLESLKAGSRVRIYTDSSYVLRGMEEWLANWKSNGWVTSSGKPVKNQDLWKKIARLQEKYRIELVKVKGHSGDDMNNRADQLAKKACEKACKEGQ